MNPSAAKYFAGGWVKIGVTDKNTATPKVIYGTINGTLYGRGKFGRVFLNTNKQVTAIP